MRTRWDDGGLAFLHLTREPSDDDVIGLIKDTNIGDVGRVLDSISADHGGGVNPASETEFFLLAISANGGRLVVRDWMHDSIAKVKTNLAGWFLSLRIADVFNGGKTSVPCKLDDLVKSISSPHADNHDSVNAELFMAIMRRALFGVPLGCAPLAATLNRLRRENGSNRLEAARIAFIRVCLNDILVPTASPDRAIGESLDQKERQPAYVCGRLLAAFERLQYEAYRAKDDPKKTINSAVIDRFYGMASVRPDLACPRLEAISQIHLKKLHRAKPGVRFVLERVINELRNILLSNGAKYPGQFSLENQGLFAIGFHHERARSQARIQQVKEKITLADVPKD